MIENIENREDGATTLDLYAVPLDVLELTPFELKALLRIGFSSIGDCMDCYQRYKEDPISLVYARQPAADVLYNVVFPQLVQLGYL